MYQHKVPEREKPPKEQYIIHRGTIPSRDELNGEGFLIASFDPATENFAYRIEQRSINTVLTLSSFKLRFDTEVREGRMELYKQITEVLNGLPYLTSLRMVVIERQLPVNYNAVRVSQHLISYFLLLPSNNLCLMEVNPQVKTRALHAPKGLNKNGIKSWSGEEARRLCRLRGDLQMLELLDRNEKKDDDLADTVVQVEGLLKVLKLIA